MPGVSPNIDWPISRDLGEPYRVGLGPKPRPGSTSWPFQPMPHQEGHLLVNTRLGSLEPGKFSSVYYFTCIFLNSLYATITTPQRRMASDVNCIFHWFEIPHFTPLFWFWFCEDWSNLGKSLKPPSLLCPEAQQAQCPGGDSGRAAPVGEGTEKQKSAAICYRGKAGLWGFCVFTQRGLDPSRRAQATPACRALEA